MLLFRMLPGKSIEAVFSPNLRAVKRTGFGQETGA
jgi:hypothetical protein